MRAFSGYNFKSDTLADLNRQIFDQYIASLNDEYASSEWKIGERVYLLRRKSTQLVIWGIGSNGIIWGANEDHVKQILFASKLTDKAYAYKVEENTVYFIENGEAYIYLRKGTRINTPKGDGVVYSIDDLNDLCIELDNDKEVFYEFAVNEISKKEN